MPALVSIAFAMPGQLTELSRLWQHLDAHGVGATAPDVPEEGQISSPRRFSLRGVDVELVVRAYQEQDWVSVSLDLSEERFEEVADSRGRAVTTAELVSLAEGLLTELRLVYVHIDEEAEAESSPDAWNGDELVGITLLPADSPAAAVVRRRDDLLRLEERPGVLVAYRRLDPVPHHPAAWG